MSEGRRFRAVSARLAVALVFLATAGLALAQEKSAEGVPPPKDTIFARKILMGAIDMNMDEIETMLEPEGKLELNDAQEHAETISTMLMAFPHMLPASTNQWKAGADRDRQSGRADPPALTQGRAFPARADWP